MKVLIIQFVKFKISVFTKMAQMEQLLKLK